MHENKEVFSYVVFEEKKSALSLSSASSSSGCKIFNMGNNSGAFASVGSALFELSNVLFVLML